MIENSRPDCEVRRKYSFLKQTADNPARIGYTGIAPSSADAMSVKHLREAIA